MPIVAILNQKGGVGKTTMAVNLARALQSKHQNILLIDSDTQGSARDWHAASNGDLLKVIGLDRPTLDKDIKLFSHIYEWILIDGSPHLESMAISAVKCSDIVLIPVQPSPYDIWASEDLIDIIKARQSIMNGMPKAAFVVSRQIANTALGKEVREALNGYNLPVFKNGTFQRITYTKTAAIGTTVLDDDPHGTAANEIKAITNELMEFSK